MVEHLLGKEKVSGSIPLVGSKYARIAQLVEQLIRNEQVVGSSLTAGSNIMIRIENKKTYKGDGFYIGRPSPLGNPFPVDAKTSRTKAISLYHAYIRGCNRDVR